MNLYHIWANLRPGVKDLDFVEAVQAYLGYIRQRGHIQSYRITRRKFGFSPPGLGDFHIIIECTNLQQLDDAFLLVATRDGEIEKLHARVYGSVSDFASALYRDFPDDVRKPPTNHKP
jgi:hypothetical protein